MKVFYPAEPVKQLTKPLPVDNMMLLSILFYSCGHSLSMKQKTRDALDILHKVTGDDPELKQMIEEETLNAKINRLIYDARQQAGLTQQGLAELVGTTQPVILRLEDADYEGHSLSILQRNCYCTELEGRDPFRTSLAPGKDLNTNSLSAGS